MASAGGKIWVAAALLAAVAALSGCNRNRYPLTPCIDGKPLIERTKDVAPPNCTG